MATPSVTTINQTNTTTLPQWYTDYMSELAARGAAMQGTDRPTPKLNADGTPVLDAAGNPVMNPARPLRYDFDADGNPRNMDEQVADLSADEEKAYADIRRGQGGYNPYLNQATRMTEAGAQQDIYGAYSPYGQRASQFGENAGGIDIGGAYSPYGDQANRQAIAGANFDTQRTVQPYFNRGNDLDAYGAAASGDQQYYQGIGAAGAALNRGYAAGDRDTSSAFDPYSNEALDYTRSGANMNGLAVASPYLNAASGSFTQNANAYMNPYNEQVTDRIAQLGARNLSENILPSIGSDFIKSGGYGSTSQRDSIGRAVRDTQESILGQQAQALQQGYGQAAQAYQADAARQAGLAGTAGNLGLGQGSLQLQAGQQVGNIGQTALQGEQTDAARQLQAAQLGSQTGLGISSAGLQRGQLGLSAAQLESQNNLALLNAQAGVSENAAQRQLQGAAMSNTIGNSAMAARQANASNQLQAGQLQLGIGQAGANARQAQANSMYQAGSQFASLGNQQQTQYLRDAAALESAGAARRGVTQAGLNARTANAREREAYPWLNLNRGAALVSGAQLPSVGSQRGQTTSPGPSTAGQVGGGIAAGAALYNMFNKAKGGAVKKKPNSRVNYGGSPRRGLSMFAKAS